MKAFLAGSLAYVHPEVGRIYGADPLDAITKTLDFLSCLVGPGHQWPRATQTECSTALRV